MKILGLRKEYGSNGYKNDWLTFYPEFHKWNFRFGPASYFDNRFYITFCIVWGQFYIHIPWIRSEYDECDPPEYGFYFYSNSGKMPDNFVICKGKKTKHYDLPWAYQWVRTSILLKDGTWDHETKGNRKSYYEDEWKEKRLIEQHPYKYTLNNGEVQGRICDVTVTEREWRPKWFKWTSYFAHKRRVIDIEFNAEVGEKTGSWKGGCLGCSWDLLPGETIKNSLMRMEKERKFS
jgi:hypothetical protein